MKKPFNFMLIKKQKKRIYTYNYELDNKLFGNNWFKKPKLISNEDFNLISYIIANLKIKQESPDKYNYIENKEQNTSFYSTIDLLNDEA